MSHKPDPASPTMITHGCRLNGYESEAMRSLGAAAGLEHAIIVNSCAVTNEAVRQTRQSIRKARASNPKAPVIVTGCAAQINPTAFAAMPEVDAVIGNQEKLSQERWHDLASDLAKARPHQPAESPSDAILMVNDIMAVRETAPHLIDGYGDRARAFLQIQNGCDHRCTFCIIPYGRGNSRSVPVQQVIDQAQRLVDAGHREIVLTGVDITSWGADIDGTPQLGDLVGQILDTVPELYRLRLSSIDGAEIDDALYERITDDSRVAPYLHLSIQSGDDMILKRMKRRHTRAQAIDLCHAVRDCRPDIAFGADIIAGFPTETEEMFQNSVDFIEEAGLQFVHVFPFSAREGTPAARMPQLDRAAVKARAAQLRAAAKAHLHQFLDTLIGQTHEAIVESGGRARLGNFAQAQLPQAQLIQSQLTEAQLTEIQLTKAQLLNDGPFSPGAVIPLTITGRDDQMLRSMINPASTMLDVSHG